MIFVTVLLILVGVRANSLWERQVKARRILHGLILPLHHYLGLLDHEIQGDVEEIDNLFRQAVLDHVTELRAFLLQPMSQDLTLSGKVPWAINLNNLLLALEETLETEADEFDVTELDAVELRAQVSHLLQFIQNNPFLSKLTKKPLGLIHVSGG